MRSYALALSIPLLLCATSAFGQTALKTEDIKPSITFEGSIHRTTGSIYPDQQEYLSKRPATEAEAEICVGDNVCLYHWSASTDDGDTFERDHMVYVGSERDEISFGILAGINEVPGADLWDALVIVSRPVGAWTTTASVEILRSSDFKDTVGRVEAEREFPLTERLTASVLVAAHYGDYAGAGASSEASLTYWLTRATGIGGSLEAFTGEHGSGLALKAGVRLRF